MPSTRTGVCLQHLTRSHSNTTLPGQKTWGQTVHHHPIIRTFFWTELICFCLASQMFLFHCHTPIRDKKKTSIWEHWDYWTWVHCVRYFHKHFTRLAISWWSAGGSRNHRNILVTSVVFDSRLLQVLQLLSWVQRRLKSTSYALWIFKWLASKRITIITHILIWIQQLFTFSVTNSVTVSTE